ncbi:hypothetical protein BegalDRAFT_2812 [Beggiatoa alba B18LD]|uniref:Uncharacterized protein n=1 Tax=Beggiatoa alba B18LD TaxID=395493 RepID=I3CJ54_9GAMM|nr:hypothetical protein [Beggiatoa alba]EIJ43647.1 hypothetical protein BegalDRAFT_2812 [Beggiatoa alba B18LD]
MKYLESLKQQAAQKKEQEQALERQLADKNGIFNQAVKPAFRKLFHCLYDLVQNLNYLQPEIKKTYVLPNNDGQFVNFKQGQYSISVEKEDGDEFLLRFKCVGDFPTIVHKSNERDALLLKDFLWAQGVTFKYTEQEEKNKFSRALFTINPLIVISFKVFANSKTNKIDIDVSNFENFGKKEYSLSPELITDTFLDAFAQYLLRENTELKLPPRYVLPEKYRAEIKRQIQAKDIEEFNDWLAHHQEATPDKQQGLLKKVFGFLKK